MGKQQYLVVVLLMASLFLFFGCEDGKLPFSVEIVDVSTTMDTVTITFSEEITEIDMPNSISFASGTFTFTVSDAGGTAVELGLLDSTADSVTLAVLGRSNITGTYQFTLILGDETDSVLEKSKDVVFTTWSGTTYYLDIFGYDGGTRKIMMQVTNSTADASDANLVVNLVASDFKVFDNQGDIASYSFSKYGDYEYIFTLNSTPSGKYWIRFSKTGYRPGYDAINFY